MSIQFNKKVLSAFKKKIYINIVHFREKTIFFFLDDLVWIVTLYECRRSQHYFGFRLKPTLFFLLINLNFKWILTFFLRISIWIPTYIVFISVYIWGNVHSLSNVHSSPRNCQIEKSLLKVFWANIGLSAFIWTQWTILIQKNWSNIHFHQKRPILSVKSGKLHNSDSNCQKSNLLSLSSKSFFYSS